MTTATVIVFEKRPRWTPELQRQFVGEDVRVRGCRSLSDVAQAGNTGGTVAVLDLDAAPADCLQFLGRSIQQRDCTPMIVIGSYRTADLEWNVRELGALAYLHGDCSGEEPARLCRRLWRKTLAPKSS